MRAIYAGVCSECRTAIEVGQEIRLVPPMGGMAPTLYAHADPCDEVIAVRVRRDLGAPCPVCWLHHRPGACDL